MQSAMNVGNENTTALVDAATLRSMTATRESIYEKEKNSILDAFMSTMVRQATESGKNGYVAQLHPTFDRTMLADITKTLTDLGYTVKTEDSESAQLGKFILIDISW